MNKTESTQNRLLKSSRKGEFKKRVKLFFEQIYPGRTLKTQDIDKLYTYLLAFKRCTVLFIDQEEIDSVFLEQTFKDELKQYADDYIFVD